MNIKIDKRSALIVVDVQKDFCQGGALQVPLGDEVVPVLNRYIRKFEEAGAQIYATRDWHPSNHVSFKSQGGPWPSHCVQNTEGAEFHRDLLLSKDTIIISKANPLKEAYSGFDETNLEADLKRKNIRKVFVGGLATDYCVLNTVLDALRLGFATFLLKDAIKGVNLQPNDSERAIKKMQSKGIHIIRNIDAIF